MASEQGKRAKEDADAVAALAAQLRAAKEEYRGLQEAAKGEGPKTRLEAAKAAVNDLATSYKALAAAKKEADRGEEKRAKDADKKAKEAQKAEEKRFKDQEKRRADEDKAVKEEKKALEEGAGKASDLLKSGAEAVTKAALAVTAAAAGLVAGAVKLGIESTAAADKQRRALGYLTRGFGEASGKGRGVVQGDLAYRVTLALASEKGVAPEAALERMRRLIDAKFGREQTEMLFRVSADLGEVKGEGKAEELLGQLEAIKRLDGKLEDAKGRRNYKAIELERGGAQAAALDKFAESGIKASEVLGLLARKGESLQQVSLRLRRGRIDADEFSKAVATVAGKDVAGAAGKGLDATINRAKIGLRSLFEGWDLSPIDELGKKLDDALKSPEGKDLKKSIDEIGKAMLDVLKNVSTDDLRSFFTSAAEAAHALAEGIRIARDMASDLVKVGKDIGLIGEKAERQGGPREIDVGGEKKAIYAPKGDKDAEETGKAFDEGLAKGIDENAAKVKEAGARAAKGAATGANEALGIHSPSTVATEQGKNYGQGWEIGIDAFAPRVAGAAARLAGGVARSGGAAGGQVGVGAAGGEGNIIINAPFAPAITLTGGATAADAERVRSLLADDYAGRHLPNLRQAFRDAREMASPPGGG